MPLAILDHVFLPCKMASKRIPRKNLQSVGGRSLLDLQIYRFQVWFPAARIWVATEDHDVQRHVINCGCKAYPLTAADIEDRRTVSVLFQEWLLLRRPDERCLLSHLTSPFTFRSELQRAVGDPRPFVVSAWSGYLPLQPPPGQRFALSQHSAESTLVTGNFACTGGQHQIAATDWTHNLSPVSWLSSLDINSLEDLADADKIARSMPLGAFDDVRERDQCAA